MIIPDDYTQQPVITILKDIVSKKFPYTGNRLTGKYVRFRQVEYSYKDSIHPTITVLHIDTYNGGYINIIHNVPNGFNLDKFIKDFEIATQNNYRVLFNNDRRDQFLKDWIENEKD